MIKAVKSFVKTTIIGGLGVILPVAILVFVFAWIWGFIAGLIRPLTTQILTRQPNLQDIVAEVIVLWIILLVCFFLGLALKTAVGRFIHETIEKGLLRRVPGYSLVKETVQSFLGGKKAPFSSVALCQIFANDTLVTAFITDEHEDGSFTVFVPTGPNPTSGQIFHLLPQYVHLVDLPPEDVMRSIISCGAGSGRLIQQYRQHAAAADGRSTAERARRVEGPE